MNTIKQVNRRVRKEWKIALHNLGKSESIVEWAENMVCFLSTPQYAEYKDGKWVRLNDTKAEKVVVLTGRSAHFPEGLRVKILKVLRQAESGTYVIVTSGDPLIVTSGALEMCGTKTFTITLGKRLSIEE